MCLVIQSCLTLYDSMWTVALQAPLSMRFLWKEYWSGLPSPTPAQNENVGFSFLKIFKKPRAESFYPQGPTVQLSHMGSWSCLPQFLGLDGDLSLCLSPLLLSFSLFTL